MRKILPVGICLIVLCACDKHDPVLPGVRTAIFAQNDMNVLNTTVASLPDNVPSREITDCPYTQNTSNVIMYNGARVYAGFPTQNTVKGNQKPVCSSNAVYAGLTNGVVVKLKRSDNSFVWHADVFKASNMTGGTSVVDIVAPMILDGDSLYVAGLGNAFCRLDVQTGIDKWCAEIGSAHPFVLLKNVAYIVGNDNNLYAVRIKDGAIYWKSPVEANNAPQYENKIITVGGQKFDASSGSVL